MKPIGKEVVVESAHKLMSIVTDEFIAGEQSHLPPGARKQNSGTQNHERDSDGDKEEQHLLFAKTPTCLRELLENPVIANADSHEVRNIFRRDHRTVRRSGRPVVDV